MSNFFITTAIDYINGKPHLGHAYEKIGADVLNRYKKLAGVSSYLLVGTDEHSVNVINSAEAAGLDPKAYCDRMALHFQQLCSIFNISYDRFIRTTDNDHREVIQQVVQTLWERGYIRKGSYSGFYCESCEAFLQKEQLLDGYCPNHPSKKAVWVDEENYFFTLSLFQKQLEQHIEAHPQFIQPISRRNEINNRLKEGLRDISISRSSVQWGIPFPQDSSHTVYVWFDALLNYLTGSGYLSSEAAYQDNWPADVQIIGKDITWFHCIIWPAILLALELTLPQKVFGHGFINLHGEKLSKTSGVVLDPFALAEEFSADVIRYYLMKAIPWGQDGNFSLDGLITTYNNDLANDFGNLLSRTTAMINKYFAGRIPAPAAQTTADQEIIAAAQETINNYHCFMEKMQYVDALTEVMNLVGRANLYIETTAPWRLFADTSRHAILATVLYNLIETIRLATWMLHPFMPSLKNRVWSQLGLELETPQCKDGLIWGYAYHNVQINRQSPLFPRRI